ncbi:three prime repair exonuclease 2-like [Spodoptera litura]|uniref:Three prime repair exonuclease 2-like n=1 Tax=Spodoptera litura TaxID=69820 RepID=A0A9J7ELS4_SPOLT|nr:three prime repair exonuclease 2-like [Spodoptera litura]
MAVATYVFVDLQSNCVPKSNKEIEITELCMLAIKHSHIVKNKDVNDPRIQHKLQMCFNPKSSLHENASETGLTKNLLKNEATLNMEVCQLIKAFIEGLEAPVCLVAHDGFKFHYPLLVHHLKEFGVELNKNIVCTDSLYAFLEILESEKKGSTKYVKVKVGKKPKKNTISKAKQHYIHIVNGTDKDLIHMRKSINNYKNINDLYNNNCEYEDEGLESNRAESHCIMLMRMVLSKKDQFLAWLENNLCLFSEMPNKL